MVREWKTPQDLLKVENRRRIFDFIRSRPGVHMRQIQRELGISMGTLDYHLRMLERNGLVVSRVNNLFKAYFTEGELDRRDKDYMYYLRQRMPRKIALEISRSQPIPWKQLVERMPVAASTVSFHLKKLVQNEIVSEVEFDGQKSYQLNNTDRLERLIANYGHTFDGETIGIHHLRQAIVGVLDGLDPHRPFQPEASLAPAP